MADKKKRNKIKVGSFVTPIGVASYPHLVTPDTKWKPEGEYRCPLIYDEATADTIRAKLQPLLDKGFEELKKEHFGDTPNAVKAKRMGKEDLPIKALEDEEGNETGQYRISPKKTASGEKKDGTPWKAKVNVFDSKGKKLLPPPAVWGGSKLRADCDVYAYYAAKDNVVGLTLEIVGVQIIELVSGGGERESAFGEVEGGYEAADREDTFGGSDDTDAADGEDDTSADF
ncbi:hypothetical protein [Xanthobacter sp. YC-JY1]|uniref:hypothetical protein n=1 Tax=Xanthobacter sp. YC-JY1 TaxID=2419844 RepID=UPI001F25789A|nr:hypothetical protein [Xanthobacter sp. YC-JY1]UJX45776.1 DUF2815 family protein [Xanthobacter sp. YC-JY1]